MLEIVTTVVSIVATVLTVGLLFCGLPICLQIRKQGHVGDISGFPFITGILVSAFYLRYGLLKDDRVFIFMNSIAIVFMFSYAMFFLYYSKSKKNYLIQLSIVFLIVMSMEIWMQIKPDLQLLGIMATVLNLVNFGAPLAGLRVVLRDREVSTLPFALCSVQFLVLFMWCIYGVLCQDIFIVLPAASGMTLGAIQLSLFLVFPRSKEDLSPLEILAQWFTGRDILEMERKLKNDQGPYKI
ncbi:hypothetical protein B9Z55_016878 [Caenorhabditis nigoni]|uniref:Sugar transporter SWEET n=1 Tax=Caenorhabditis nigoni TaxID=1611254 RepID=A0A2G5T727_9PELO|nr:hypothetical protein B9Z55_016878 [Caenorhabditis nigoni]